MAEEIYHGHRVTYSSGEARPEAGGDDQGETAPSLTIDDRDIDVVVHSDGSYSAREYYYEKFGSLQALGRAIARGLPDTD